MYLKICVGMVLLFVTLLAIAGCGTERASTPQKFKADVEILFGGQTISGQLWVDGSKYRVDILTAEPPLAILVDSEVDSSWIVNPKIGQYQVIASNSEISRKKDPFQGLKYIMEIGESANLGTEKYEGFDCEKILIKMNDRDLMTQWFALSLGFPIKIVDHTRPNTSIEVKNISREDFDENTFILPSKFIRVDAEQNTREETSFIDTLPPVAGENIIGRQAPVLENVKAGYELRVKTDPSKSVYVRFKNTGQMPAECYIRFLKDGEEITGQKVGTASYRNVTLEKSGLATNNTWDQPGADETVIRILRGMMSLEVKHP